MSTKSARGDRLVIGGPPRAELLPPEFAAEARLRTQRRGMVAVAILSVVVVGLVYGYVTLRSTVTAQLLASANAETTSLLSQQAEYAIVGIVRQCDTAYRVGFNPCFGHPSFRRLHVVFNWRA